MAFKDKKIDPEARARVADGLAAVIRAHLTDGRLDCAAAFHIAAEHDVTLREIGRAADALGIKIRRCQLGAF